jgi:adenylylsulfate kinase-like enzyme
MIIWIIGLSGSGKTKLSNELFKSKIINNNFINLDGDEFRKNISNDLGYSYKDRKKNAERISRFVKYLSKKKINIIVSVLSNYPEWLKWNRNNIKNYLQVYIKVNKEKLFVRNKKNLYLSKKKNVVGKDIKFNEPKFNDLVLDNNFKKKEILKFKTQVLKLIKSHDFKKK